MRENTVCKLLSYCLIFFWKLKTAKPVVINEKLKKNLLLVFFVNITFLAKILPDKFELLSTILTIYYNFDINTKLKFAEVFYSCILKFVPITKLSNFLHLHPCSKGKDTNKHLKINQTVYFRVLQADWSLSVLGKSWVRLAVLLSQYKVVGRYFIDSSSIHTWGWRGALCAAHTLTCNKSWPECKKAITRHNYCAPAADTFLSLTRGLSDRRLH